MATQRKPSTANKKPLASRLFSYFKRMFLKLMLWFFGISIVMVVLLKFIPVFFTPLMVIRFFENTFQGKEVVYSHQWTPIENISTNLQKAVISSEDGLFLTHNGFDFDAMTKAFKNNSKGRKIKGGSTISQQTAKNVFLWQGRSYLRKALEAYFTLLIELIWDKQRIMEVYLNSIEMGDGIYGAEAATQYWYGKSCNNLTKTQAAGIAAILPSPRRYKANATTNYIVRRKAKIVRIMNTIGELKY
jgi:monofunctional glycosyltransferase